MALIPGFPKILTLGDRITRDIWKGPVEITEKIDGSQFSFGRVQGHVYMRSKGADIVHEDNNKIFDPAKAFVRSIEELLPEGVIFHGEFVGRPKHNTLIYRRVPKNFVMMFGITAEEDWKLQFGEHPYQQRDHWCRILGCEEVPVLFQGDAPEGDKYDWLMEFISEESVLGQAQREGVVIKNYAQPVFLAGLSTPFMSAKIVSQEFKEKHKVAWNQGAGKDRLTLIGESLNAKPRWLKAIQRMRDDGNLTDSPRDIGPLLKSLHEDIEAEEVENIKEMLWKLFSKDIKRIAVSGFPEFYKDYLIHGLTSDKEEVINAGTSDLTPSTNDGHGMGVPTTIAGGDTTVQPVASDTYVVGAQGLVSGHDGEQEQVLVHNTVGPQAGGDITPG